MITYFSLIFSLLGAYFTTSYKPGERLAGFILYIMGNIIWMCDAAIRGDIQQIILWASYTMLSLLGVRNNWKEMRVLHG